MLQKILILLPSQRLSAQLNMSAVHQKGVGVSFSEKMGNAEPRWNAREGQAYSHAGKNPAVPSLDVALVSFLTESDLIRNCHSHRPFISL